MKAKMSFMETDLQKVLNSSSENLATDVIERYEYVDKVKTDKLEAIVVTAISRELGEIQFHFPPKQGLYEELNDMLSFATPFKVSDIGEVDDVKISIYNNGLTFKFLMT